MRLQIFFLLGILAVGIHAQFEFRLSNYFHDGMVLQRAPKRNRIFGYGNPGARIEIDDGQTIYQSDVNDYGTWSVILNPKQEPPISEPIKISQQIVNAGNETIELWVNYGDVWLCSGESNMQMTMNEVYNATQEIEKALMYKNIRLMQIGKDYSVDSQFDVRNITIPWSRPTKEYVEKFSATCLLFGEKMSEVFLDNLNIGLIDASYADTAIESWISDRVLSFCNTPENENVDQNSNSAVWNAMIAPLTKTSVRGVVWYQGESNVNFNTDYYQCHISTMIQDWTNTFLDGHVPMDVLEVAFPFGVAQIGPIDNGNPKGYGILRLKQTADQGILPNALMPEAFIAATYDLTDRTQGENFRDKQTVGHRLARAAQSMLYFDYVPKYGPVPIAASFISPTEFVIDYDVEIQIGQLGFTYEDEWGTAQAAFAQTNSSTVTVTIPAAASHLYYGFRALVCEYKECGVYYIDNWEDRPAQVWQWDLSSFRDLERV